MDRSMENFPNASRAGYTFVGWFTEEEEGELITNRTKGFDHTLYA